MEKNLQYYLDQLKALNFKDMCMKTTFSSPGTRPMTN